MVTGIECAGLLLAVLPLFIEAAKVYGHGVNSLKNVVVEDRMDAALKEFLIDLHEQVVAINCYINSIYSYMSQTISAGDLPTPTELFTKWQHDPSLEQALRAYFRRDDLFDWFTLISLKISKLLDSLIKDKATKLSPMDPKREQELQRLKDVALRGVADMPKTSYRDRFRFFKRKQKRDEFLRKLRDCTENLGKLIPCVGNPASDIQLDSTQPSSAANARAESATALSFKVRSIITTLHSALEKHWSCTCKAEHKVRLRLSKGSYPRNEKDVALEFLVSIQSTDSSCRWQEARVLITPKSDAHRNHVKTLCELSKPGASLNFWIEDINGQQTMWQLPSNPCTFHFSERDDPSSLYELIDGPGIMHREEKLKIAITLSYSLLFLHDSDWLPRGWKKEDIFFFYKGEDEPDYESPYLSARFAGTKQLLNSDEGDGVLAPPNEGILSLGILLLEIFKEKPIERWRKSKSKQNVDTFTDWCMAEKVVKSMDPTPSQSAIKACLDWMREVTNEIRLEEKDVRIKLFNQVIAPLEKELESLESLNIKLK